MVFVGESVNDCQTLNQEDIGLSIGNSDASMASPFVIASEVVGKIKDIWKMDRFTFQNFIQIYFTIYWRSWTLAHF